MPRYIVKKPFGWNGKTLNIGEMIEIEQGSKADALVRAKFVALTESGAKIPAQTSSRAQTPSEDGRPASSPGMSPDPVVVYCVKCKGKRSLQDPRIVTLKHGRQAMQGKCSECGTKLHRMKKKVE